MLTNRRRFTSGITGTLLAGKVASVLAQTAPEDADPTEQFLAVLDELRVPGAAIAHIPPGETEPMYYEVGVADAATNEPISADMHFRISTTTKSFVSTVILQLVDEGVLSLEDTISTVLPDLKIANADTATIRNLLAMRSGIRDFYENWDYMQDYWSSYEAMSKPFDFDEYILNWADMPAMAEADLVFYDGFLDYHILGEVMEAATSEAWDVSVQSRILEPLGLANTFKPTSPEMPEPYAMGHGLWNSDFAKAEGLWDFATGTPTLINDSGVTHLELFNPEIHGAAGALVSTVKDLIIWVQAYTRGDLISPEMHAERMITQPRYQDDDGGCGLGIIHRSGGGNIWGHYGAGPGYQSNMLTDLDTGAHLAICSNIEPTVGFTSGPHHLGLVLMPNVEE